jgi:hypothetical protein
MKKLVLGFVLLLGSTIAAQDRKKEPPAAGHPGVDSKRVDEAIRRGLEFLRKAPSPAAPKGIPNSDELILLTMVHGDVPPTDAKFRELFDRMMQAKLTHTYKVALQAMVLEEMDRVKYQDRIAQCAQALIDNQLKSGQWNYECAGDLNAPVPTGTPVPKPTASTAKAAPKPPPGTRVKPAVVRQITLQRSKFGASDRGDNSNSQYAALGLRAAHDAGVVVPAEVIELARKWWETNQQGAKPEKPDVATGGTSSAPARGWDYSKGGVSNEKAFGSMTAGAISAVAIYDYILKKDWRQDAVIQTGLSWLDANFSVTTNPVKYPEFQYYYLYALERVGMLCSITMVGSHDWYREGANYLLGAQGAEGSWRGGTLFRGQEDAQTTWDTCFAILFLKRATRSLDVASVDRFSRP